MEITSFIKERKEIEEMFVTEIEHNGNDYTLASYVYNGELAESETGPSFWNADEFRELKLSDQQKIKTMVNEHLIRFLK